MFDRGDDDYGDNHSEDGNDSDDGDSEVDVESDYTDKSESDEMEMTRSCRCSSGALDQQE